MTRKATDRVAITVLICPALSAVRASLVLVFKFDDVLQGVILLTLAIVAQELAGHSCKYAPTEILEALCYAGETTAAGETTTQGKPLRQEKPLQHGAMQCWRRGATSIEPDAMIAYVSLIVVLHWRHMLP